MATRPQYLSPRPQEWLENLMDTIDPDRNAPPPNPQHVMDRSASRSAEEWGQLEIALARRRRQRAAVAGASAAGIAPRPGPSSSRATMDQQPAAVAQHSPESKVHRQPRPVARGQRPTLSLQQAFIEVETMRQESLRRNPPSARDIRNKGWHYYYGDMPDLDELRAEEARAQEARNRRRAENL